MTRGAPLLLALAIFACAPAIKNANEAGGRIDQLGSMGNDRAFSLAEAHCAKFGKVAIVTDRSVLNHSSQFECRNR
ncbi:hypothetical protein KX816_07720 [Sphingosinicellaceae bacterium]|nr:hypothetical protein KX816_07720 [Sphingosinicellaceae bacterium]